MPYIYHTDDDRRKMLDFLELSSEEELFDKIPPKLLLKASLSLGAGRSEHETWKFFVALGKKNHPAGNMVSFLGGGIYDSFVPSAVKHLAGRSEFYTAYTPYQPEVSQGTLQVIFEFQSLISRLTGLPVSNASMYDGATALAEAALMAIKVKGRKSILVPENLNPRYTGVLRSYLRGRGTSITMIPFTPSGELDYAALRAALDDRTAGVILQTPNYFGVLERPWEVQEEIKKNGSLLITCADPVSLSVLRPCGDCGADIAVGEGQSLGNEMNLGGPLLGFMACKQELIRQMPGRIVSQTRDIEGREAYVLVLQTREQHIRRDQATSNICTNEGLLALRAAVYLSLLGESGFRELGLVCSEGSHRLSEMISTSKRYRLKFGGPFFREFVIECPTEAERIVLAARRAGILAGIPLGRYFGSWAKNCLLVAVTEKRTIAELERFVDILQGIGR